MASNQGLLNKQRPWSNKLASHRQYFEVSLFVYFQFQAVLKMYTRKAM